MNYKTYTYAYLFTLAAQYERSYCVMYEEVYNELQTRTYANLLTIVVQTDRPRAAR